MIYEICLVSDITNDFKPFFSSVYHATRMDWMIGFTIPPDWILEQPIYAD